MNDSMMNDELNLVFIPSRRPLPRKGESRVDTSLKDSPSPGQLCRLRSIPTVVLGFLFSVDLGW